LFIERFSAEALGDDASWEVRLEIELGATADGPQRAQVSVAWAGDANGQTLITTNGGGMARVNVGPFIGDSLTFTITDVRSDKWVYVPELNLANTSVTVTAPEGDDD
jgi:hypothetical protein